jgi:uncharacterized repeat protein (TIGR02543 family)
MTANRATFMRKARRFVASFIPLVLAVSTLSAISIVTAPTASAAQDAECIIGSSSSCPATSPQEIFNLYGTTTDGSYWLKVNGQARETFLIMNSSAPDGGMWFLGMKAPKGSTTFKNDSTFWTNQTTTTGTTSLSNDVAADAKFDAFNYLPVVKIVAVFRDRDSFNFNASGSGDLGSNNRFAGHTWQETISEQSMFTRFTTNQNLVDQNGNQSTYRTRNTLLRETDSSTGKLVFPYQTGWSRYGFNNTSAYVYRWGVTFNNETSNGSNDTGSGIGMADFSAAAQVSYSDGSTVGPNASTPSGVSNPGTYVYPSGFQIWGKTPNPSLAAPASLAASIPAAGQVNLSWATFSGATDYVVQYKTAAASSYSNSFRVSGQTTASITGLTSSTSYNFRVFARTATNSTSSANIGNSTITATPQTTPGAPSITGITPGNMTLSVAFNPPSTDGGATITNYQYSTDGGSNWRTRDSGTTASPLVINTTSAATPVTLTNGTTYNVQIRAVNVVGNGAATSSTTGTPTFPSCSPTENPSPPAGFTVLTFTNATTCNWSVPAGVTVAQVLVVGGGGGGGGAHDNAASGGGGAGYVYANSSLSISGTISIVVGAGGTGGVGVTGGSPQNGNSGGNSTFGSVTALGGAGGFGGYESWTGSCPTFTTPVKGGTAATPSQAATGGQDGCFNRNGFGGGGQSPTQNQTGGAGLANSITGTSVTYGTGGTGGTDNADVTPSAQPSNTGNGGTGAASRASFGRTGGTGGSGVVIVRYANGGAAGAAVTTQPSGAVSRSALTTQPVIRIVDGNGITITSSTVNVVASIASGSGTLSGTTTVAAVNGIATFTNLVITGTGNHTLTFTPTSLAAATSSSFSVSETPITANALTSKVTAPVRAATPLTTAVDDTQFTGTVAWFESNGTTAAPSTFAANTVYVAKVTLTAKTGYTLTGLSGSFTYTGATSVSYSSGVVTITFAATDLAPRTISFATTAYNKAYLETQIVSATASLGSGTVTYSVGSSTACTVNGSTVTISSGTGTCLVTASVASDGTYASATTTTPVTITVSKAVSTIGLSGGTYTYTGSGLGPDSATTSGSTGAVTYAYAGRGSTSYASSSNKPTAVGTYTVTATLAADTNYASVATAAQNFEITNAGLVVTPTISASSMTYGTSGGSLPTISYTKNPDISLTTNPTCALYLASDTGFVTVQTLGSTLAAGSYVVRCAGAAATNYTISYGTNPSFTVTKLDITLTVGNPASTPYTGSSVSVTNTFTRTSGTLAGSDAISGMTYTYTSAGGYNSTTAPTAGGNYTITGSNATFSTGSASNYTITYVAGALTITTATQTVTWAPNTNLLTTDSPATPSALATALGSATISYAVTSAGTTGCTVNSSTAVLTFTAAGNCQVTATAAATSNYATASTAVTFAISIPTYVITLAAGTNGSGSNQTLTKTRGVDLTLPNSATANGYFTRTGYSVTGWSTTNLGSQTHALGGSFTTEAATTLYPVWTLVSCSPTSSVANGYTIYRFTTVGTCTWTVPNGLTNVEVLAVAGGGGGGYSYGNTGAGGGGGGQVKTGTATLGPTLEVTVGAGGTAGTLSAGRGGSGGNSIVSSITALGGTGGCGVASPSCSVASAATASAAANGGAADQPVTGFSWKRGRGGGGSSGVRGTETGGDGTASDYSGTSTSYGAGGSGGSKQDSSANIVGTTGTANTGNGGGGAATGTSSDSDSSLGANGGAGGSGVVVVRTGNTLNITYDANGGSAPSGGAATTITGGTISSLATTSRTGYTFSGWFTAASGGTQITTSAAHTRSANFILYAQWSGNSLTVTYDSQGGSAVTSGSVNSGANISAAPTAPTRAGYTLSGWSTTSTGSVVTFPFAHNQTASFTLYAIWSANALTITYDSKGGTAVTSGTVNTAASISSAPTAPTRTGYTFSAWSATDGGTAITFPYAHGQTANFTLYAIWTANTLTVTYNSQGGSAVTSGSVAADAKISTAPTPPTRAGYTFSGWSTTSSGSVVSFTGGYTHGQTASFTLYAIWLANSLTITYDSQGGSAVTSGSVNTGANISVAPTAPTRAGYTFSAWSAADGGTAITFPYAHGQTANFTLYAIWSANALTVTYNAKGGTTVSDGTVNTAASISAAPTAPTRTGYTLSGWSATDGGTVVTFPYAHGQTANFTLYAKWTAVTTNPITYNNQSATTPQVGGSTTYTTDAAIATIPTTAPLRVGYTFAGWFTDPSAGTQVTNGTYTPASPYGSITLYAQWTANSLTVTYNSKGGTTVSNGSVNTAASISTAPTAPTRAGYTFTAWSATDGGTAITFPYAHGQTANFTLYALWTAGSLVVTYNSQGGSAVSNGTAATGASISSAPTAPTRTGYTFDGWSATETGTVVTFPFAHGQTTNFTLYARWSLRVYSVAFNANSGTGTMGNQSFTHGVTTSLNANLYSRANYVFHRWATAADGTGTTYNNFAQAALTAETTLYAQWTPNTYVVTFNYNGGDGGDSTATASYTTAGTAITLPVPTKTGFTFAGWHSDAGLTTAIGSGGGSGSYSPTGATLSLNAYAKWTAINYTFTYNSNSADSGTVPTETSKQITQTATVKANTGSLALAGYTFSGWNTASDGTGTNYLSGSLFTVGSSNVTLYAKWSANTYTITYNTNGGTGNAQRSSTNVSSDTYTTGGSSVVFPGIGTLERIGFTFGGWNTSAAGTGTNYSAANTYTTVSNVIFYAKWNPVTYTITYNGNTSNGGSAPTAGGYTTGQASPYEVLANTFTKTSNVFGGWNTAADGTGTSYSPNSSITTLANIVLYATWIPQFTLHYAINGGTVTSGSLPSDTLHNSGASVGPIFGSVSRTGYTFAGWANGSATILGGSNFTILEDSVLTAKWNPINYTISYNSDGGTEAPATSTKQIGQSFIVEAAVSKPGYTFTGWSNGSTVVGADAVVVMGSANIAYTAQWVARVFTVSYDWNGGRGTAEADVNYTFGTTAITLPLVGDRVKDGYTFAGWSESVSGSLLSATYIPSRSRTLYAIWTLGSFTVTYNLSGGTLANAAVAVQNGSSTVLPLPTRANFVFDGWHTATAGGSSLGSHGTSFTPTASQTVYARWIQSSLYGITDSLTRIGSVVTVANVGNTFSGANSSSSVAVSVPENALPAGTTINFDMVGNSSRATGLLPNVTYLISIAISWIAGDGTVPDTASGKPISVTISNATIKTGATAYAIVNNVSTLLGTATQDGTITIDLTSDPEIVIAAVRPSAPLNVTATANGNQQSVISWSTPASNGGSEITNYTVTSNTNATCTTSATSCTISGLANGTGYTFTVTAANSVGTSVASSSASATTAAVYSVAFNSRGGTSVSSGSFLTASSVNEPTAPTRSGYTFVGWSATDGGSVITFPYAPGVTSNITLFARWAALDNAVTFDSKGGSSVTNTVFASGGTLAAPVTPTRSGFTFAGWSATDGGSAISFPYAPGVVTPITLYAKWTPVVSIVVNTTTVIAPVTVTGAKEVKISTAGVFTPISASDLRPLGVKIDENSKEFIAEVKVIEGKLVLTPEVGFSGKKIVTATITENGIDRIIQIPLTVLPENVTKPVLTPVSSSKSTIRWVASPNATAYTVYLSGKKVCSTPTTSCSVARVLGPNAVIEVVSNGGDSTVSQRVDADFKLNGPLLVTRVVSATKTKAVLSSVDTTALYKVIPLVKSQGFKTIVISKITTTKKTEALAAARIAAIKKFISEKSGVKDINFEIVPATSNTYFNNIYVKG